MKYKLVLTSMVMGAIVCSTSAVVGAANVAPQVSDTAKHDAVQSNWVDRTDIAVGVQTGGKSKLDKGHFLTDDQNTIYNKQSDYGNLTKAYIETLQPISHYDENSKSVLFVQGRIGRGGEKIASKELRGYLLPELTINRNGQPSYTKINTDEKSSETLGIVGTVGIGYRRLSRNEHAYVGVNAFYDHVFKGGYKRVSGGVEYVAGLNEFHANLYRNLGTDDRKYTGLPGRTNRLGDPTGLYPYGMDPDQSLYNYGVVSYENHWMLLEKVAASGFDVGYSRTFKNARWARVYADYYNWRGREAVRVGYYKLKKRDAIKGFKVGAEFHITPHLTLDAGYQTASHHLSGPYAILKYTIGTSKFAWRGGKHSESAITTARSKMLDKVHRSDMVVQETVEETYDHGVVDVGL